MSALQRLLKHTDLVFGFGLLVIVGMLIMPLPHWAVDFGLILAMGASILVILTSINVKDPMQFSVFPSLLVVTTLFRLALSMAATKLILGTGTAGHVIETFGGFVLGGDFVVGFIAFLILMIVQFLVITNGATRVSEVVARFTLDAMPGKQMAIDADLAAGLIDEDRARKRRKAIKQEADFYGSMDGASKFVKGDAIASILIVVVNLIGGVIIGLTKGGDFGSVWQQYAVLTVGEGLVSQIPALLISTSAGLLVTRNGQDASMGGTVIGQFLSHPNVLKSAAGALALFAFIPGFPPLMFLALGGGLFGVAQFANKNQASVQEMLADKPEEPMANLAEQVEIAPNSPEAVMPLLSVDALEIELGYGLTKIADVRVGGDLPDRVGATRTQVATELGFVMPSVRIRDNAILDANEYVIKVRGEEVARALCFADDFLAIVPSPEVINQIPGTPTKEPVFGLDAIWITEDHREQAEQLGCTVVIPSAMVATHLAEVVQNHSAELLTRQDVQKLLDNLKDTHGAVVEALTPDVAQIGDVQKVLQHLLRERVPIRDLVTILETVIDFAQRVKDPDHLGELARAAVARTISRQFQDPTGKMYCLTLNAPLERAMQEALHTTAAGTTLALEPSLQKQFTIEVEELYNNCVVMGQAPVLLCSSTLRLPLKRLVERSVMKLPVLAYNEISAQAEVEFVGQVTAGGVAAAA